MKKNNENNQLTSSSGQGIIEYAGALVVATLIVSGMMTIGPDGMAGVFMTVVETVESTITDVLSVL